MPNKSFKEEKNFFKYGSLFYDEVVSEAEIVYVIYGINI